MTRRWTLTPRVLLAVLAGGALVALVLAVASPLEPLVLAPALVARVSGMLAGYGAAVMLILMSRSPVIEHGVGSDRLARWHSRMGPTVIGLALVHALAAIQAWAGVRGIHLLAATREVLGWPGLLAAALGLILLVVVGLGSLRWVRRRMPYEHWHLFHLLAYLAVALGFIHQLAGPDLAGNRPAQIGWSLLYAYAFALVIRYRLVQPLHQMWRHRLKVEQIVRESGDVVSIVMSGAHLDELQAEPGQFFRWRFLTPTTWAGSYPFSLSAPPTNDRLRITIKAVGLGTRLLHDLHPGTVVLAEGPYGALTERRRRRRRVLLVAGGVGITPMRVLFETLDLPGKDLTLVYRASSEEEVVFRAELDEIAARKGARVVYLIGSSEEPENLLNAYTLRAMVGPLRDYDVYLCAPPRMATRLRESLLHTGHSRRQLHEEQFTF
ncbi:MAG TPA: ferric reductase-like transmembrane domain-containing protein [Propionibacteriaceae bacterium]|nr:ferric reductase-like transmembrane domain-containing protein [Propionibacteriaceae bacterium]